jgi:hypothetical protein
MYVCYSQHPGFSCADNSDKIIGDMIEEGNQRRIELFKKLSIAQLKLTPTVIQALHTRTRKTPIKAAIQTSNNNAPKKKSQANSSIEDALEEEEDDDDDNDEEDELDLDVTHIPNSKKDAKLAVHTADLGGKLVLPFIKKQYLKMDEHSNTHQYISKTLAPFNRELQQKKQSSNRLDRVRSELTRNTQQPKTSICSRRYIVIRNPLQIARVNSIENEAGVSTLSLNWPLKIAEDSGYRSCVTLFSPITSTSIGMFEY